MTQILAAMLSILGVGFMLLLLHAVDEIESFDRSCVASGGTTTFTDGRLACLGLSGETP